MLSLNDHPSVARLRVNLRCERYPRSHRKSLENFPKILLRFSQALTNRGSTVLSGDFQLETSNVSCGELKDSSERIFSDGSIKECLIRFLFSTVVCIVVLLSGDNQSLGDFR